MEEQKISYSWLPFFEELLNKICSECDSYSLHKIWNQLFPEKYTDIEQIDPFSLIGKVNSLGDKNYKKCCKELKNIFKLKSEIPLDFNGIPRTNRTNPIFFNEYWKSSKKVSMDEIMKNLWNLARCLNNEDINENILKIVLQYNGIGLSKLTQLFFLCKPKKYYSYDSVNRAYLEKKTNTITENTISGFFEFQELAKEIQKEMYIFSYNAWKNKEYVIDTVKMRDGINSNTKLNKNQRTNGTSEVANVRYIVKYIDAVRRNRHNQLEKSFKKYLLSKNIKESNIKQNLHFIDFIFENKGKQYICELKPSNQDEIRYAIRNSIGQIIEYDYSDNCVYDYKVIVFQKKPTKEFLNYLEYIKNKYEIYYLTEIKDGIFEGNLAL